MGVFDVRSEFAKLLAHVYSTLWLGMALTAFSW